MKIIENARDILFRSYVAWIVYLGTAAQIVFEFGFGSSLPGWVNALLLLLILLGRTLKQESISGPSVLAPEFTGGETQ
jgi:hypothetical protein